MNGQKNETLTYCLFETANITFTKHMHELYLQD